MPYLAVSLRYSRFLQGTQNTLPFGYTRQKTIWRTIVFRRFLATASINFLVAVHKNRQIFGPFVIYREHFSIAPRRCLGVLVATAHNAVRARQVRLIHNSLLRPSKVYRQYYVAYAPTLSHRRCDKVGKTTYRRQHEKNSISAGFDSINQRICRR